VLESAEQAHREALRLMQAGDWRTADATCERLTVQYPNFAAGWFAASHIAMALRSPANSLAAIDRALAVEPLNVGFLTHRAQCLLALNRRQDALNMTDAVERCAPTNPAIWDAIGMVRTGANDVRCRTTIRQKMQD
jgi:predicted Zn-dependent protease